MSAGKPRTLKKVFESDRISSVYSYYIAVRRDRAMPARADIDPSAIKRQLPYVYICQVERVKDGPAFRFRLMGTELVTVLREEGTGRYIRELNLGGYEQTWRESALAAYRARCPIVAIDAIALKTGFSVEAEHLMLPLSEDGEQVDRLLGAIDFLGYTDDQLTRVFEQVDWADVDRVEVPKRLLITNLAMPID